MNSSTRSLSLVIKVWRKDSSTELRRPRFSFWTLQGGACWPGPPPFPLSPAPLLVPERSWCQHGWPLVSGESCARADWWTLAPPWRGSQVGFWSFSTLAECWLCSLFPNSGDSLSSHADSIKCAGWPGGDVCSCGIQNTAETCGSARSMVCEASGIPSCCVLFKTQWN